MNELLAKTKVASFDNAEYAVLDAANGIYVYNSANAKIMQEIDDPTLKDIVGKASSQNANGFLTDSANTYAYMYMNDIGLIVSMKYDTAKLMKEKGEAE